MNTNALIQPLTTPLTTPLIQPPTQTVTVASVPDVKTAWRPGSDTIALLALIAIGLLLPFIVSSYHLRVATGMFMMIGLAQAWNLIGGYAGAMSLGQAAFFGVGAIVTSVFLINHAAAPAAILGGSLAALLVAAAIGHVTLRLKGHYFVVATMLVVEALRNVVLNLELFGFSGKRSVSLTDLVGLKGMDYVQFNQFFYGVMFSTAIVATVTVLALAGSRWGLALKALRDSPGAAAVLGVPVAASKFVAFAVSALLAGLIGGLWACWNGTVETNEAFGFTMTFEIIVMVFLGGRGTLWGPILGVVCISLLNEFIGTEYAEIQLIISGAIIVAVVLLQPDGLAEIIRTRGRSLAPSAIVANLKRYRG
ncbi:branched-chain amino acid ABC transporter permease [soil metagenome]